MHTAIKWLITTTIPATSAACRKKTLNVGTGLVGAPECGDVMKLQIEDQSRYPVIEEAKFKTFGCGSAIASSSLATEWVKGKTVEEALSIKNTDIVRELSLPPVKIHCSVLAEDAIKGRHRRLEEKAWRRSARPRKRRRTKFSLRRQSLVLSLVVAPAAAGCALAWRDRIRGVLEHLTMAQKSQVQTSRKST